jgi:phosphoribosylformimino-5-aminoimidazole carboxamide ribotide isomerase
LGSLVVKDPSRVQDFIARFGIEKIVLALDFRLQGALPLLALNGWQETSSLSFWDVLETYNSKVSILCTDISRDGMECGPAFSFYEEFCKRYDGDRMQASGGVNSLGDLKALKSMGIGSVIVGKALYRGTISLSEAIKCSR